jgi:hypothetical protein
MRLRGAPISLQGAQHLVCLAQAAAAAAAAEALRARGGPEPALGTTSGVQAQHNVKPTTYGAVRDAVLEIFGFGGTPRAAAAAGASAQRAKFSEAKPDESLKHDATTSKEDEGSMWDIQAPQTGALEEQYNTRAGTDINVQPLDN